MKPNFVEVIALAGSAGEVVATALGVNENKKDGHQRDPRAEAREAMREAEKTLRAKIQAAEDAEKEQKKLKAENLSIICALNFALYVLL